MGTRQTVTPIGTVVAGYFDLWNETDAAARGAALGAVYVAVVCLMPWPLFALALLGCIDCLIPHLRRGSGIRITKLPTRRQ